MTLNCHRVRPLEFRNRENGVVYLKSLQIVANDDKGLWHTQRARRRS